MRRRTFTGISRDIAIIRRFLGRHLVHGPRDPDRIRPRRRVGIDHRKALKAGA